MTSKREAYGWGGPSANRDEETDGFYTNSTNIKNTELKSLAVSLDETVRNGGTFNEHLSCDAECEKTNCYLLKGQLQLVGPSCFY